MHRAVGEEYPAQAVGFQPVAIEEDEAFAGFALQLQPLAHLIKILAVGGSGTERSISSLASSSHWLWRICVRVMGRDALPPRKQTHQQQGDGEQAAAGEIPAGAARAGWGGGFLFREGARSARLPRAAAPAPGWRRDGDGEIRIELQHPRDTVTIMLSIS
jgi:hypothetical protein